MGVPEFGTVSGWGEGDGAGGGAGAGGGGGVGAGVLPGRRQTLDVQVVAPRSQLLLIFEANEIDMLVYSANLNQLFVSRHGTKYIEKLTQNQ